MQTKKKPGLAEWTDPDDAPRLTAAMLGDAEVFAGDTFVRRGRGRPPTGNAKEQISIRLDRDVLARLREAGPGWQVQVNELLRVGLGLAASSSAPKTLSDESGAAEWAYGDTRTGRAFVRGK